MTHKKKILMICAAVITLSLAAYLAADRFLIEHVEIADVNAYASAAAATFEADGSPSTETGAAAESADVATGVQSVTYDDWNYHSAGLSISISQVSNGSGRDALTYFVADVQLTNAAQLRSAFANNQFGRNIIAYTSEIAAANNAIFAINGDYYGFRSDGIIIRDGVIYRDQPARAGLAIYRDGSMQAYEEMQTSAEALLAEGAWNTLSFGPALLDDGQIVQNLGTVEIDTNIGNHPIQGDQPRTGLGMIDENHFVFIVVDGRSKGYSSGVSLEEFAQLFAELGCTEAYNLDGGGSATMYFMGRVVNNPLGRNKERGTSDILYIGAEV